MIVPPGRVRKLVQLLGAASAAVLAMAATPALAEEFTWFPHGGGGGGGGTCPYTAKLSEDGCTSANQNAMFKVSNSGTLNGAPTGFGMSLQTLANASNISWTGAHPPSFNLSDVDFPEGPDATKAAAWKDPALIGSSVPGCSYLPAGGGSLNPNGGPELSCNSASPVVLDGYEFGPTGGHGCTWVRPGTLTKSLTISNGHFVNDDTCGPKGVDGAVGITGSAMVYTNNLFDGKWAGFTGSANYSVTTASQTVPLPNADEYARLMRISGTAGTVYYKYGTSSGQTCDTTSNNDGNFSDLDGGANSPTTGKHGANTYVCLVTASGSASVTVAMTASPNPWWTGIGDNSTAACSMMITGNVFIHMPADLGGNNLTNCSLSVHNNLSYDINGAATSHSAWFVTTSTAGTSSSPTVINSYDYSYNLCIQPSTAVPGAGSTCFSNLMQSNWVQETNLTIAGNLAVVNYASSSLAGFAALHKANNAALFYASAGRVTGTASIHDNWIDPQGATACYTTDGMTATTGGVTGSVSGTTLTITAISGTGGGYAYPGEVLAGTGLTNATIVSQLSNLDGGGNPFKAGTYQLDTSEPALSSSSNWRLYNTPIATLDEHDNFNLTTGNPVTMGAVGGKFNGSLNWAGGMCENHG